MNKKLHAQYVAALREDIGMTVHGVTHDDRKTRLLTDWIIELMSFSPEENCGSSLTFD
jgi:hypothetical protein